METLIEKAGENDTAVYEKAGAIIKNGGLVAFPTETVYGLGGDAFNPDSSKKIYAAKGRPSDNPLIVHIAEMSALDKLSDNIPEILYDLADAFWPGPLTMIIKKKQAVPSETTGGLDTVAIRMPDHPVALQLIRAGGGYIAAPSANASGRPSPTLASHVEEDLNGRIDMIIDGGEVGIGIESTIVDLSGDVPMILRPGYVTRDMLERVIGTVETDPTLMKKTEGGRPKAPGMRYRHYAPKGDMQIFAGEMSSVAETINKRVRQSSRRCGILCSDESIRLYDDKGIIIRSLGSRTDLRSVALNIYRALREFDDEGIEEIYAESFDTEGFGQAVMNRMLKAAGYNIINTEETK
ncbi:MAG: threonylcarbamoyl-AMP synthase [Lachnospiraceae bacterium]|nr:threonylcarbamoyl-AMP synthase [Lachnospiraceae bacterium]